MASEHIHSAGAPLSAAEEGSRDPAMQAGEAATPSTEACQGGRSSVLTPPAHSVSHASAASSTTSLSAAVVIPNPNPIPAPPPPHPQGQQGDQTPPAGHDLLLNRGGKRQRTGRGRGRPSAREIEAQEEYTPEHDLAAAGHEPRGRAGSRSGAAEEHQALNPATQMSSKEEGKQVTECLKEYLPKKPNGRPAPLGLQMVKNKGVRIEFNHQSKGRIWGPTHNFEQFQSIVRDIWGSKGKAHQFQLLPSWETVVDHSHQPSTTLAIETDRAKRVPQQGPPQIMTDVSRGCSPAAAAANGGDGGGGASSGPAVESCKRDFMLMRTDPRTIFSRLPEGVKTTFALGGTDLITVTIGPFQDAGGGDYYVQGTATPRQRGKKGWSFSQDLSSKIVAALGGYASSLARLRPLDYHFIEGPGGVRIIVDRKD
ncbi:unnamed protein product [Vitrella brassicaformis CCMP3155]|uniref:Uncharacterized protein n=1 Tax=Vitrella brassicaformis (strain CCMP3155) TaxID=1169540 RepID=A0A0G4EQV9_VITBC|nr:unnamed protein product [Vitrella brassicaformis CCMP3155]|eukprot:CEL99831.1 unnamed protein product [Vitrella brassicaformis CCMP3155]